MNKPFKCQCGMYLFDYMLIDNKCPICKQPISTVFSMLEDIVKGGSK